MSSSDSDNDSVPQKVAPKKGAAKSAAVAPASKAGDKRKAAKEASDSDSDSGSEDEQAKPAAEEEEEEVSIHAHTSAVQSVSLCASVCPRRALTHSPLFCSTHCAGSLEAVEQEGTRRGGERCQRC